MRDGGLLVRIWPCNAVPIPPVGKTDSQGVNNQACNDARKGAPPTCGRALPFGSFTAPMGFNSAPCFDVASLACAGIGSSFPSFRAMSAFLGSVLSKAARNR